MKTWIELYIQQFKTTLAMMFQYRASLFIWMIGQVLEPLVYLIVWTVVSNQNGGRVQNFFLCLRVQFQFLGKVDVFRFALALCRFHEFMEFYHNGLVLMQHMAKVFLQPFCHGYYNVSVRRQLTICQHSQQPQRRQSVLLFLHKMGVKRPRNRLRSRAGFPTGLGR